MFISGTGGTGKHAKQCSLLEELSLKRYFVYSGCSTDFLKALRDFYDMKALLDFSWNAVLQALTKNTKQ